MLRSARSTFLLAVAKLAAVGLLAGCVLAGSACSKHEPPVAVVLEAGGVSVKRVRDVELGATDKRRGRVGDWVMVSKGISFVVGRGFWPKVSCRLPATVTV